MNSGSRAAGLPPSSSCRSCGTAAELPAGAAAEASAAVRWGELGGSPAAQDCRRRQFSSRSTPAGAAGLSPKLRQQSGGGSSAAAGSSAPGVQSLSPPCLLLWTTVKASAAVRQLRWGELGGSPAALAEKGNVLPELSCRDPPARADCPLVHKILTVL